MNQEMVRAESTGIMPASVEEIRSQVVLIQKLMKDVLQEEVHFGVIPGTGDKKALLKPGAEKLALLFRFATTYKEDIKELPGGHREYEITARLTNRADGALIGEGLGTCTTLESKYRYRSTATGRAVPPEYWESRDPEILGGPTFMPKKVDGQWKVFQKVEHPDPADYYNTCRKMAAKRALVHAVITATAAGDIFDQDLEEEDRAPGAEHAEADAAAEAEKAQIARDLDASAKAMEENQAAPVQAQPAPKATAKPKPAAAQPAGNKYPPATDEQKALAGKFFDAVRESGADWKDAMAVLHKHGIRHTEKITADKITTIVAEIKALGDQP